jgi:hypothetical protein
MLAEVAFGLLAGLLTAVAPRIGAGIAVHCGLLWALALGLAGLAPNMIVYAGVVEPLYANALSGLTFLNHLVPLNGVLPYRVFHYHLSYAAPTILLLVVLGAVLAGVLSRRIGAGPALAVVVAGPALAAIGYGFNWSALYLWGEDGAQLAALTAILLTLVAGPTAGLARLGRPPQPDRPGRR